MLTFFSAIVPVITLAVGVWLGFELVRQNGRILLRLDSIDRRLARRSSPKRRSEPRGLPIGAQAPDFELPDLLGGRKSLADFRGRNALLVFFNPQCGFCVRMADDLKRLTQAARKHTSDGEWTEPIVITTGDCEENRRFFKEHGIRCTVLLQEQMQTASTYQVNGTPMGYLLDRNGKIASELTVGAEGLLQLAGTVSLPVNHQAGSSGSAKKHKAPDPSLAKSRINRDGLKAGTPAPEFVLPRIDGGELALTSLRGRQVLLVFSDPDCGPCDEIAPLLQELHEERDELEVVVVSRRDVATTRTKAETLGLTYTIVMQKQWEISLKYGMFATPVGYLIDEQGIIVHDVAVGVKPILALAKKADECSSQPNGWRTAAMIP